MRFVAKMLGVVTDAFSACSASGDDDGYAYMLVFASLPLRQQNRVREVLGRFPQLHEVVSVCLQRFQTDVDVPRPRRESGKWAVGPHSEKMNAKAFITQFAFSGEALYRADTADAVVGADDGYCYMQWFRSCPVRTQNAARRVFGAYPPINLVVRRLQLVLCGGTPLEEPTLVEGVWHVAVGARLVDAAQLIGRFAFDTRAVGGKRTACARPYLREALSRQGLRLIPSKCVAEGTTTGAGYCYVQWFNSLHPCRRQEVLTSLGPYPLVRDVVVRLIIEMRHDVPVPSAREGMGGVLHIADTESEVVRVSDVVRRHLFDQRRIGGTFTEFLDATRLAADRAVRAAVAAATEDTPSPPVPSTIDLVTRRVSELLPAGVTDTVTAEMRQELTDAAVRVADMCRDDAATAVVHVAAGVAESVAADVTELVVDETATAAIEGVVNCAADVAADQGREAVVVLVGEIARTTAADATVEGSEAAASLIVGAVADAVAAADGGDVTRALTDVARDALTATVASADAAVIATVDVPAAGEVVSDVATEVGEALSAGVTAIAEAAQGAVAASASSVSRAAGHARSAAVTGASAAADAATASMRRLHNGAVAVWSAVRGAVGRATDQLPDADRVEDAVMRAVVMTREQGVVIARRTARAQRRLVSVARLLGGGYVRYSFGVIIWVRVAEKCYFQPRYGRATARAMMAKSGADTLVVALVPGACLNVCARAVDALLRVAGEPDGALRAVTFGVGHRYITSVVDLPWVLTTYVVRRPCTAFIGAMMVLGVPVLTRWALARCGAKSTRSGDQNAAAAINAIRASPLARSDPTVVRSAAAVAGVAAGVLAVRGILIGGNTMPQQGGAEVGPESAVATYVAPMSRSAAIGTVMKAARHEHEPHLQRIAEDLLMQRAYTHPESFTNEVAPLVERARKRFGYHPSMSSRHVARLEETFPGVTFYADNTQMAANCHEVGAVARRVMTHVIYEKMDAYEPTQTLDRSDIGGNEELSFNADTRVHYCRMLADIRDGARVTRRRLNLLRVAAERPGLDRVFAPGGARVCTEGAENCPFETPVTCEIHVYDIPMATRAIIFDRKKVVQHFQVFNFFPLILVSDAGYCPTAEYCFEKRGSQIVFWFRNSMSELYEHDYEAYIAPVRDSVLITPEGRVYHIERGAIVIGQLLVTYTEATTFVMEKILENAKSEVMISMEWEKYRVFPYIDVMPGAKLLSGSEYVVRYDAAPCDSIERAIRIADASRRKPDGPYNISSQIQQFNSKRVINGSTMRAEAELSQETLSHLTTYAIAMAILSARTTALTTDVLERALPTKGAERARLLDVWRANSEICRFIVDLIWPTSTAEEVSDMDKSFCRDYRKNVGPSITDFLTRAPDQAFAMFVTTRITAGPPTVHYGLSLEYIQRQQLSREYARRLLQERPEPPRVIVALSRAEFKARSRIHRTGPQDPVQVRFPIQGRRADVDIPDADTIVRTRGDGYCAFRAVQICFGVRYVLDAEGYGEPALHPEAHRVMLHGLWTHARDYFDALPGATEYARRMFEAEFTDEDAERCLTPMGLPATWSGINHIRAFSRLSNADLLNIYNGVKSWFVTADAEPNMTRWGAITMEENALTHADAYAKEFAGVEDEMWRAFFHVLRTCCPATSDPGRQERKLAELLVFIPSPTGRLLEVGCAPGAWHAPLRVFAAGQEIDAISPVGSGFLPLAQRYSVSNVIDATISGYDSRGVVYQTIVSDAATGSSWETNAEFDDLLRRLPTLLAQHGNIVVKVSNYTLVRFNDAYCRAARQFREARLVKPESSRARNSEAYFVGLGYGEEYERATELIPFISATSLRAAEWYKASQRVHTVRIGGDRATAEEESSAGESDALNESADTVVEVRTTADTAVEERPVTDADAPTQTPKNGGVRQYLPDVSGVGRAVCGLVSAAATALAVTPTNESHVRRVYSSGHATSAMTEVVVHRPRPDSVITTRADAYFAAPLVCLPPKDPHHPKRSSDPTGATFTCCVYHPCTDRKCAVHKVCTLLPEDRVRCVAHGRCSNSLHDCRRRHCRVPKEDNPKDDVKVTNAAGAADKVDDGAGATPEDDDEADDATEVGSVGTPSDAVFLCGGDSEKRDMWAPNHANGNSNAWNYRSASLVSTASDSGFSVTPHDSTSMASIRSGAATPTVVAESQRTAPATMKKKKEKPGCWPRRPKIQDAVPEDKPLVLKSTALCAIGELGELLRRPVGDCERPTVSLHYVDDETDRATRTGEMCGIYRYGVVLVFGDDSLMVTLRGRGLLARSVTLTTGQRAHVLRPRQVGLVDSKLTPVVVVVNTRYRDWDRSLQCLIRSFGQQHRVVPVLVDSFSKSDYLRVGAALRLQPGARYTFVTPGSQVPVEVTHVIRNVTAELQVVSSETQIMRLFPKTDYAEGVVSAVNLADCTSAYEKAVMAADEYMQIQKAYRRYLEPALAAAENVLFDSDAKSDDVMALLTQGYNVVNLETGKLRYRDVPGEVTAMSCAYRRGVFTQADKEGVFAGTGEAVVCRETFLMFDLAFVNLYGKAVIGETLAEFFWLNGPPGCGKTYMITKNFRDGVAVLTATKAGRDDVIRSLAAGGVSDGQLEHVRTVASAVMNPKKILGVDTVLVDEATMIHPGQLVFLATAVPTVQRFVLIGDVNQIPFIDRLRMGNVQYHRAADVCMKLPDLSVTRRCPAQVVYALQARYPGLMTTSEELGKVEVVRSLADVPTVCDCLYMTFTQAEKTELISKLNVQNGKPVVLTVAEAQGQTYEHTVVYRSNINKIPIYEDEAQVTTAFTRHKKVLTYYTSYAEDDLLIKWMIKASTAGLEAMRSLIQLVPVVDAEKMLLYRRAGLDIGAAPSTATAKKMTERRVPRDFCSRAGQAYRSSGPARGQSSSCQSTSRTTRQPTGSCPITQMRVGGSSRLKVDVNTHIITARPLLSRPSYANGHGSVKSRVNDRPPITPVAARTGGRGADRTNRRGIETSSCDTAYPLCTSQASDLPRGINNDESSNRNDRPTRNEVSSSRTLSTAVQDVSSSLRSRNVADTRVRKMIGTVTTGMQQTAHSRITCRQEQVELVNTDGNLNDRALTSLPGGERLRRLLEARDCPIMTDAARCSLADEVFARRIMKKRKSWSTKTKDHAVAYTAAEVYSNLDSVAEDYESYVSEERDIDTVLPRTPAVRAVASVGALQAAYDALFPATVGVDYSADAQMVEESSLHVTVGDVAIDSGADQAAPSSYDTLEPALRTMIASRRPMSQAELLLGFQKRNANVPHISSGLLPPVLADTAYDNFVRSAVGDVDEFATFSDRPIAICERRFDEWVKLQPNEAVQRYLSRSDVGMDEKLTNYFSYMIKVALKPPVKNSEAMTYQSVQTIAFSSKDINAIFSPIFIEMSARWLGVMKRKYKYYTRLSPDEFERVFNADTDVEQLFRSERVENDISKYDKSMGPWYLLFETRLYRALGMPDWLVDIWYASHVVSTYGERESGFRAQVHFQRRSGDASTFFGNTLINHCCAMAVYNDDDVTCGVFAGDDAVLFGDGISYDASGAYADTFNFESKTFTNFSYPYFCGKFLIPTDLGVYFVPDPIKTLTKWGRRDLRNSDHVRQYYVSCRDGLAPLDNEYVMYDLCYALTERYGDACGDYDNVIRTMLAFVDDEESFSSLYHTVEGGRYLVDPSLPDTDL